nr:MAG TPA: hypothetical protein [Caudoviricetes sp.]
MSFIFKSFLSIKSNITPLTSFSRSSTFVLLFIFFVTLSNFRILNLVTYFF